MIVMYDKIEDYIKKIEQMMKDTQLYVSIKQNITETGIITPMILIQATYDNNTYMFAYREDLPKFQLASDLLFDVLPEMEIREKARICYDTSYKNFENKVKEEYNKLVSILKDICVKHGLILIENASIQ